MRKKTLVEEAKKRAEEVLLGNASDLGLLASRRAYQQVWARDAMISSLGLLLIDDPEARKVHQRSLETLRSFQSPLGNIPHHVGYPGVSDPALIAYGGQLIAADETRSHSPQADTGHAGCVDGSLWYIVGHSLYFKAGGDLDYLGEAWPSLESAFLWLRYQDSNECGLLEVHEAMDWADLFANRYNVLYDNALYVAATRAMGELAAALGRDSGAYDYLAEDTNKKLNLLLWVGPEQPKDMGWVEANRREWVYPLELTQLQLVERPFYLPYMAFRDYADRCDVFGNLLAILFDVADDKKREKILDYIHSCGLDTPFPVRCLHPVVQPGEKDWREYYRIRNVNLPHQYHNGGAWPFIGGFYVAALAKAGRLAEAESQLERLAEMNRLGKKGDWEFNEWFHGQSGRPMGFPLQTWSAAMYIYAYHAVREGAAPFLG